MPSGNGFNLDQFKILSSGNGLKACIDSEDVIDLKC